MNKIFTLACLGLLIFLASCQEDDEIVNGQIQVELRSGESYVYGFDLDDASSEVIIIAAPEHAADYAIRRGQGNELEFYYLADATYTGEDYAEFNICDRSGSSSCRSSTMRIYFRITP